jgi:hypothetical protein
LKDIHQIVVERLAAKIEGDQTNDLAVRPTHSLFVRARL